MFFCVINDQLNNDLRSQSTSLGYWTEQSHRWKLWDVSLSIHNDEPTKNTNKYNQGDEWGQKIKWWVFRLWIFRFLSNCIFLFEQETSYMALCFRYKSRLYLYQIIDLIKPDCPWLWIERDSCGIGKPITKYDANRR